MYDLHDDLKGRLEDASATALEKAECKLLLGHVCWGNLSRLGAMRMTHIAAAQEQASAMEIATSTHGTSHTNAFRNHIARFGRSATLLHWLTLWIYSKLQFVDDKPAEAVNFAVRVVEVGPNFRFQSGEIVINREFLSTVAPVDITLEYLEGLYKPVLDRDVSEEERRFQEEERRFQAERLIGARLQGLNQIASDAGALAALHELSAVYPLRSSQSERDWLFMGALQTALTFLIGATPNQGTVMGFASVAVGYNVSESSSSCNENPLAILSGIFSTEDDLRKIRAEFTSILRQAIETQIRRFTKFRFLPSAERLAEFRKERWDARSVRRAVLEDAPKQWDVIPFPRWTPSLVLWLAVMTDALRESVHEGEPLTFCFVTGDLSQVQDSGLFESLVLDFEDTAGQQFLPWDSSGHLFSDTEVLALIDSLKRHVGKKNYTWFQEGKYALLWDSTFPSKFPKMLIRIRGSSWNVFVSHARMGKPHPVSEAILAMSYVGGDGSGGMIISGRQALAFHKSRKWYLGASFRQQSIKRVLSHALSTWEGCHSSTMEHIANFFSDAIVAIAENPHSGCMLAVCRGESCPQFQDMGGPWRTENGDSPLNMTLDEVTALMGMDGATVLSQNGGTPRIHFRRLVQVPDKALKLHASAEGRLDGEGARKWSGAYAASRDEFALVISVSQDGPIYIYEHEQLAGEIKIRYLGPEDLEDESKAESEHRRGRVLHDGVSVNEIDA